MDVGALARVHDRDRWAADVAQPRRLLRPPVAAHLCHGRRRVGAGGDRRRSRSACARCSTRPARTARVGLSVNHFDKDRTLRLVPGYFADDAEYRALFDVVARYPGRTVQVITRFNDPDHWLDRRRTFRPPVSRPACAAMAGRADRRARTTTSATPAWDLHHRAARRRRRLLAQRRVQAARAVLRLRALDRVPARACVERDGERTRTTTSSRLLADPAWRARARYEWDNRPHVATSRVDRPHSLIFAISETGAGPTRHLAGRLRRRRRQHVSDALADWLVRNGIGSSLVGTPDELDEEDVVTCCAIPRRSPTSTTVAPICSCSAVPVRTCTCSRTTCATPGSSHRRSGALAHRAVGGFLGRTTGPSHRARSATSRCSHSTRSNCARRRGCTMCRSGRGGSRDRRGFPATVAGTPTWLDGAFTGARPGGFIRPG